jgi:hypothetical protein
MSRVGTSVRATRSSIAASAASPSWRIGCRSVVKGTGRRLAYSIVYADQTNVGGHSVVEPQQRVHETRGGPVVHAHDRVWTIGRHQRLDIRRGRGIEAVDERAVDRRVPRVERFTIAGFTRVDRRCRMRKTDERDAPASQAQQMLGDT